MYKIFRNCKTFDQVNRCEQIADTIYSRVENLKLKEPNTLFFNNIIENCSEDFAVICDVNVYLPLNFDEIVKKTVEEADCLYGYDNWGVASNSGVELGSFNNIELVRTIEIGLIPYKTECSKPAVYLDSNILLLNLKNIRKKGIKVPRTGNDDSFYCHFVLLAECYKKGLLGFIDSNLYVVQIASGNVNQKKDVMKQDDYLETYLVGSFVNNEYKVNYGNISVNQKDYSFLKNAIDERKDFYKMTFDVLKKCMLNRDKIKINIITRTSLTRFLHIERLVETFLMLDMINLSNIEYTFIFSINNALAVNITKFKSLIENYNGINIKCVFDDGVDKNKNGRFPRVNSLINAIETINGDKNNFAWIVDDDDFVFPEVSEPLSLFLNDESIFVGSSLVFEEQWNGSDNYPVKSKRIHTFNASQYSECLLGYNKTPVCSVIYPVWVLKELFNSYRFLGDYCEDYAIFLLAQKKLNVNFFDNVILAGISHHGENTVLEKDKSRWEINYATFISEVVSGNTMNKSAYELLKKATNPGHYNEIVNSLSFVFVEKLKNNKVILKLYKTFFKPLTKIFLKGN